MSGAGITKGPWVKRAGLTSGVEIVGKTVRGKDYVVARCGGKDREANGAAIVALPDLISALRGLLSQQSFPNDRAWWVKEQEEGRGDAELVIAAIDALSKAEGLSAGVEDGR